MGLSGFLSRFAMVRAFAQRVKLFSLLSLLVLAVGCGQADLDSAEEDGSDSARAAGSLSTHSFGREVQLSFFDIERGAAVSSPVMMVSAEKDEALRRALEVRAQEASYTDLRQLHYIDELGHYGPLLTADPSGYFTCYTPTLSNPNDNTFGGIVDHRGYIRLFPDGNAFSNTITYEWTLPPSDKPTLVSIGASSNPQHSDSYVTKLPEYVEADGDTITLRYELSGGGGAWSWQAYVNDTLVNELSVTPEEAYALILWPPVFKSTANGLHTITETLEGSDVLQTSSIRHVGSTTTWPYFQRGLVFTEPLPEVDPQSPEPVHIQNSIAWSDGLPLDENAVSWTVRSPVVFAAKSGTGTQIDTTWDPVERVLAQEAEDEDFEPVPFELRAQTTVYPDRQNVLLRNLTYEIVSSPFVLPGEIKIKIVNEAIDPPFVAPGASVTLTAEVATINLDVPEESITWMVRVLDPEGNPV